VVRLGSLKSLVLVCHSHSYFLRPKINFCSILPPFKTKLIQLSVTMSLWCWLVRQLGCKLVANRAIFFSSMHNMFKFIFILHDQARLFSYCVALLHFTYVVVPMGGSQNGVLRCNAPFYGLRVFL